MTQHVKKLRTRNQNNKSCAYGGKTWTVDNAKKIISPPRKSKKNILTIDLLSLDIYAPRPQVLTYRPQILREFESELRSGFRVRNGELKGSGVSGSEGGNSLFWDARQKLTSYSDSPYPKPHSTHFLVPLILIMKLVLLPLFDSQ